MDTPLLSFQELLEAVDGDVKRLDDVIRYSSIPTVVKESVSTHSYWVALYAVMIHNVLRPHDIETVGAIALRAILHDLPECVTGDVVRTFKYSSEELKKEIDNAEHLIVQKFPSPILKAYDTLARLEFKDKDYVIAVVKAADFMSLHKYMIREMRRGNREISRFYLRMEEDLDRMAKSHREGETAALRGLYFSMVESAKTVRLGG